MKQLRPRDLAQWLEVQSSPTAEDAAEHIFGVPNAVVEKLVSDYALDHLLPHPEVDIVQLRKHVAISGTLMGFAGQNGIPWWVVAAATREIGICP